LKDVLKIALLSAAVELIRHLHLSNVLSEELTQFFSGFPALKGSKIFVDGSYVPSCFVCHIVIMIRDVAFDDVHGLGPSGIVSFAAQ
jgi:hypothetical protein